MSEFSSVFPEELPKKLPPERGINDTHCIELQAGSKPVSKAPYKVSPQEHAIIQKEIEDLLAAGLIRPSNSPYASPVLLIKKPDGSIRFCTDYRQINAITKKDKFPIPRA